MKHRHNVNLNDELEAKIIKIVERLRKEDINAGIADAIRLCINNYQNKEENSIMNFNIYHYDFDGHGGMYGTTIQHVNSKEEALIVFEKECKSKIRAWNKNNIRIEEA